MNAMCDQGGLREPLGATNKVIKEHISDNHLSCYWERQKKKQSTNAQWDVEQKPARNDRFFPNPAKASNVGDGVVQVANDPKG